MNYGETMVILVLTVVVSGLYFMVLFGDIIDEKREEKNNKKNRKIRKEKEEKNETIVMYDEMIEGYGKYDTIKKEMAEIDEIITNIENKKEENKNIEEINKKIRESKGVIEKYMELEEDEKESVELTVFKILIHIKEEVTKMYEEIISEKNKLLVEKYEEKMKKIIS